MSWGLAAGGKHEPGATERESLLPCEVHSVDAAFVLLHPALLKATSVRH